MAMQLTKRPLKAIIITMTLVIGPARESFAQSGGKTFDRGMQTEESASEAARTEGMSARKDLRDFRIVDDQDKLGKKDDKAERRAKNRRPKKVPAAATTTASPSTSISTSTSPSSPTPSTEAKKEDKKEKEKEKEEKEKEEERNKKEATYVLKKSDAEKNFEQIFSGHQVSCQGCIDRQLGNIENAMENVLESTGNRADLENKVMQGILGETLKKDILELAEKMLEKDKLDENEKQQMMELLSLEYKMVIKPTQRRVHYLKGQSTLTEEESQELQKLSERIAAYSQDRPIQQLWKKCLEKFDDRSLARELRKISLFSEYYVKYIKSPKKKYTPTRITIASSTLSNTQQTVEGVDAYILGDANADTTIRKEGVIGDFEKEGDRQERLKVIREKAEEEQQRVKEKRDERDERIADGEVLSAESIKKAKEHHNRYKEYYARMESACAYPMSPFMSSGYVNSLKCKRAQDDLNRIGKGYHLKKMFELIELAQKDRDEEVKAKTRMMKESYLDGQVGFEGDMSAGVGTSASTGAGTGIGRDYSLFAPGQNYGPYANGFGQANTIPDYSNFALMNQGRGVGLGAGIDMGYNNNMNLMMANPYGGQNMMFSNGLPPQQSMGYMNGMGPYNNPYGGYGQPYGQQYGQPYGQQYGQPNMMGNGFGGFGSYGVQGNGGITF